jgi:catechol 2,3-dioxygenase-like lactoylglutathione lyase family enzyme
MGSFTGFHHCAFATGDMDMTVRWWRDLLGLRLVYATGEPGYRQYFFEVSPDSLVSFFEWPEVRKIKPKTHGAPAKGPLAFDHVCIGVEDEEALWDISARLAAAEQPVSDVIDHGFVHSL